MSAVPSTGTAERLLAIQRTAGNQAVVGLLQREPEHPSSPALTAGDPRLADPGFLICTAFCYLGIPPSAFKDAVEAMLECIFVELRAADAAGYQQRFAVVRDELAAYSKIRMMSKVLRFLLHGELGPFGIIKTTGLTKPIRDRVIAQLVAFGATHAGLLAAEAVLRKVVAVIDAVIVAGCAAYCGAQQIGARIAELTEAVAGAFAGIMRTTELLLRGAGAAIAGFLGDAVASAYGQLDPANWRLIGALPASTRADLSVLGAVLWAQVRPGSPWTTRSPEQTELDAFLLNAGRPLSSYRVPYELLASIASAIRQAIARSGGTAEITPEQLLNMSPAGLMVLLRDNGLLEFRQEPIAYATAALAPATATAAR